jgi:hypothetical protein
LFIFYILKTFFFEQSLKKSADHDLYPLEFNKTILLEVSKKVSFLLTFSHWELCQSNEKKRHQKRDEKIISKKLGSGK